MNARVQGQRAHHREVLMRLSVVVMACVALLWIGYESYRFARQPTQIGGRSIHPGALDLKALCDLTRRWFHGEPIYLDSTNATYPPASYALLWPLVGWAGVKVVCFLWAVTATVCLVVLVRISVTASGADTKLERALIALVPLAMYATGATIGNGQITIHVVALTAAALVCLRPDDWHVDWSPPGAFRISQRAATERGAVSSNRRRPQILGALLFLGALVKPLVSAPFFWIVLFVPETIWPAAFVVLGYTAVTFFSVSFQSGDLVSLFSEWLTRGAALGTAAGESNVHIWLSTLGFAHWILPASLLVLGILGAWVYRHRGGDLWVLMGVTAIATRFWAYHRWYDDLMLLFPLVALFRIVKTSRPGETTGTLAGVLFVLTLASTLAPGGLYVLPGRWREAYLMSQTVVWTSALVFLVVMASGHGRGGVCSSKWRCG